MDLRAVRPSACVVVLLSVALVVGFGSVQADFGWFSSASSPDVFASLSRSKAGDGGRVLLEEQMRRILAQSSNYIGYGALSARNVPCPAQSGRTYYTQNCRTASGAARPYTRGCNQITQCARS